LQVARIIDGWIENPKIERDEYGIKIYAHSERYVQIMTANGAIFATDNQNCNSQVIDYLRSKSYDCGYGSIGSLIGAGIAVDSTKTATK